MKDDTTTALAIGYGALLVPLMPALAVLLALWRTIFIVPLWSWYAVPLGAPTISYTQAAGVCLLLAVLRPSAMCAHKDDRKATDKWIAWIAHLLAPAVSLGAGWLLLRVMP